MADEFSFDVIKNMKLIEEYKCRILGGISSLYRDMASEETHSGDFSGSLTEILIFTYLLGDKLGVSYKQMDSKAKNKIKAEMLSEKGDRDLAAYLALLSRHLSNR